MSILINKKAKRDYSFLKDYSAGIELRGFEVKSIRTGKANMRGAHIVIRGNEAFLVGMTISPYQIANTPDDYDPERVRRLLLTKKEIIELAEYEKQKGLTIVPLSLYNSKGLIKVSLAVARGKKKYDKREEVKKRDADRKIKRTLKKQ